MPVCWNAHITRPEQSNALGPAAPHEYGEPIRLSAACTTMEPSPPGMPGVGTAASGGGAIKFVIAANIPSSGLTASGAGAEIGPGAASAVCCAGVSAWYWDLITAIW